jgi:capsular exopolysaccharide synthesis family protein
MESSSAKLAALERDLNVINPEEKTSILSARLLQLNAEYTRVQGERAHAESAFNTMQGGSMEAALVSSQGEELKKLMVRLNEARERFAAIKARYGSNHPEYENVQAAVQELEDQVNRTRQSISGQVEKEFQKTRNQESLLQKGVLATKAEYDHLNQRSFEYQRAKREADADKSLYEELVRKIREAEINAGFQNNAVRIADLARPGSNPVQPKIWLNLILAFMGSTLLGIAAAVIADTADSTIRGPEHVTSALKVQLIGTVPEVKNRSELIVRTSEAHLLPARAVNGAAGNGSSGKGRDRSFSSYDEAVRTVRNSILLSDTDGRLKILMLTSATASEGKSTLAGHIALAHAEQSRRTLLVDCDMRRPSQHKIFSQSLGVGLSDVLMGEAAWRDVVVKPVKDVPLDVILAGRPSRRSVDLIGRLLSGAMMEEFQQEYDLIILDSPPLLGFPESLQMASAADAVVVVTQAGKTNRKAVAATLTTLRLIRAKVVGLVLNQVKRFHSDQYYYYGYYGKYYSKYQRGQPREK